MCFVTNGDGSAPASYGPVAGNLIDLQTLDEHGDVVFGDVKGGGFDGVFVKDVLCYPAGRYRGRSVVSYGLVQDSQRGTEKRQWASGPGVSLGSRGKANWRPGGGRPAWSRRAKGRRLKS